MPEVCSAWGAPAPFAPELPRLELMPGYMPKCAPTSQPPWVVETSTFRKPGSSPLRIADVSLPTLASPPATVFAGVAASALSWT